MRRVLTVVGLVAVLAALGFQSKGLLSEDSFLPPDDFVQYWAAGNLNAQGKNPYDSDLLLPLETEAGNGTGETVMMWNPPHTLTLAMPFGLLPPRAAQLAWMLAGIVLIIGCADVLWRIYGGAPQRRLLAWLLAMAYVPSLYVLGAGQIGTFLLAGVTGLLAGLRWQRPMLAGASCVLMAMKPHLFALVWLALGGWVVVHFAQRRARFALRLVAGAAAASVVALVVPLLTNPSVYGQYWRAMTERGPEQWKTPTFGWLLRELFGAGRFGLQYLPILAGLTWLTACVWRRRTTEWDWLDAYPLVALVSFITASYGAWPYDMVSLLPVVMHVAAELSTAADRRWRRRGIAAFVGLNLAGAISTAAGVDSQYFIWMAPTLLAMYVYLRRPPVRATHEATSPPQPREQAKAHLAVSR